MNEKKKKFTSTHDKNTSRPRQKKTYINKYINNIIQKLK